MDSSSSEILVDVPRFLRLYKDGRFDRIAGTEIVPPSHDPETNVKSKDVLYSQQTGQSARLYIPETAAIGTSSPPKKLPLLVYFHGGGFCVETAFSPTYHTYLNSLVAEANVVAVSVDYRRAPEHPIPAAYEDSWDALKWVASHCGGAGKGTEDWLNRYVDFQNCYLSGDSAGANIAHHMAVKIGKEKLGFNLVGIILTHPYFWGKQPVGEESKEPDVRAKYEELWRFVCPTTSGPDDPWFNPIDDRPSLLSLGCTRVLVCVADKDELSHRGRYYYDKLKESGWDGEVELMEAQGEGHVFHLFNPTCESALAMLKKVAAFINQDMAYK